MQTSATAAAAKSTLRTRAINFSARFGEATSEQAERQTFWNDFFKIFEIDRKQVAAFEQLAKRASTGNHGWIDLLYPGHMAVEHKSAGEPLDEAMGQLLDYLPSLTSAEHPWLLVTCDFQNFSWQNLDEGTSGEFPLADLVDHLDMFWWLAGHPRPQDSFDNVEDANLKATDLMAVIHDRLKIAKYPEHARREWLTRVLFCLFADDTGIWDRAAFHAFIALHTNPDGRDLGSKLAHLFGEVLDKAPENRSPNLDEDLQQFEHINGDLFQETLPIPSCDPETRDALLAACVFDWSAISPAIFGSMFQNVMTPAERRHLGAHYTSEQNILKTIRPLFLDELESELDTATTKPKLEAFIDKLAGLAFFDPACGCGNFLVVAYQQIRALETEALRRLVKKQGRSGQLSINITLQCKVRVDQFYGIELEEFPAKIARTALYLVDHLCNREVGAEFGQHFARFPIPAAPHIEFGNALTVPWENVLDPADADYVFGNPPFVGMSLQTAAQRRDHDAVFAHSDADGLRTGRLDYVASWYALAYRYGQNQRAKFAFVSTNSITQGEQAREAGPLLGRYGFHIDFAHRTFRWTNDARGKAAVHVVIIGFSWQPSPAKRRLFEYEHIAGDPTEIAATHINWYLSPAADIVVGKQRKPPLGLPKLTEGSRPEDGGGLIVSDEEANEIRATDPVAAKYLQRLIGAQGMMNGGTRWCLWLGGSTPNERRTSPVLKERLKRVKAARLAAVAKTENEARKAKLRELADKPALFTAIRQPTGRYVCVPRHSSEARPIVPMALFDATDIAHDSTLTADQLPLWAFGVLQSSMFTAWVRTVCGRIKSDIRIAPDMAYNAFPFVEPSAKQRTTIESAINEVLRVRDLNPDSSLADLYSETGMPASLVDAHRDLDRAVDALFAGRKRLTTDAERFGILLSLYAKATAA